VSAPPMVFTHGEGSILHTQDGRRIVDLATGFGAAFLGHAHPGVTARLQAQAGRLLASGRQPTEGESPVAALLAAVVPRGLRPAGVYSTGMEVTEFALRIAATHTARNEFAAFARSMHGKSAMTAALGWSNAPVRPGNVHVLPFVQDTREEAILERLAAVLAPGRVAALLVEPIQGSNAAHEASGDFYDRAMALCREHGALCIFDETLTGLHRTGATFYSDGLRERPDILLFAKCLGNGFPVSSIALRDAIDVRPAALPGSTFSGNPMALAAVEATLTAMAALPMEERVGAIEQVVRSHLGGMVRDGATLRGRGAFWCLEFADRARMERAAAAIRAAGILATSGDRFVRLLPAATIEPALLREACEKVARACAVV